MLDRTSAPPAGEINFSEFTHVKQQMLKGGIPLYFLSAGEQPVLKIEFTFDSGSKYETQRSVSWLAAKMLTEGTKNQSANQIAESFDALGAHIEITPGFDQVTVSVFCLQKNFEQVLALLTEIFSQPNFSENEFELLKSNRADQIRINDQKSNLYASKKIREAFFGQHHFYGVGLLPEQIALVERQSVLNYYKEQLFNKPRIFISGLVSDREIELIEKHITFSSTKTSKANNSAINQSKEIIVEKPEALQSSIRIGWKIPTKKDPKYFDYQVANCLLGGYFGSRLMKNIREEKGYTYGISTYPVHLDDSSFGILSADVVADKTGEAISEIWHEIDQLSNVPISAEELSTVSNYMAGSFMNSINTPFQLMEKFKGIYKLGLDYKFYRDYFERLKSIGPDDVQQAVTRVFDKNESSLVVVGKLN